MELVQGHEIDEFSRLKYFRKIKKIRKTNKRNHFEITQAGNTVYSST